MSRPPVRIPGNRSCPQVVLGTVRTPRQSLLALLVVLISCTAEVVAPRGTDAPLASAAADRAPDILYVRLAGNGSQALISIVDARTGAVVRALPDGVVSRDRATLYSADAVNGASQTRVRVFDVASGRETRSFTVFGAYRTLTSNEGPAGLSGDGRWLVLTRKQVKINDLWVSGFVVVNTGTGALAGQFDVRSASVYQFVAVAPDGGSLVLNELGDGATRLRIWAAASASFVPDAVIGAGWDGHQDGYATDPVASGDGKRVLWLDAGMKNGPAVRALDLVTKRMVSTGLPAGQRSDDFEKYLLWSLALSADGATLYAANPALGAIDEFDAVTAALRRTHEITVTRAADDPILAVRRLFFPVADAKRSIRGGAILAPNGGTLYAAGAHGVAAIRTATLVTVGTWATTDVFGSLAISPDGARIYAISEQSGKIRVLRTSDGFVLGEMRLANYPGEVVRVDLAANASAVTSTAALASCGAYAAPDPSVGAEIQHLKTSATVIQVTSPCTVQVRIAGGSGTLAEFTDKVITLRATSQTTYATATQGDLAAIASVGLKAGETFTLSFDSRAFPDASYPLNYLNR